MTSYRGSCHCGHITFTADLDLSKGTTRCNCSICMKTAVTSAAGKPAQLVVHVDESTLGAYEWGSKAGKRFFCKTCGIHTHGRGHLAELGGDYMQVNINTLEGVDLRDITIGYWDGRHNNWQAGLRGEAWPL